MTPEQKDLVQSSFKKVSPIADTAASIFYDRLFALNPNLKPLFPDDISEQKKKLMATLGYAVLNLKSWEVAGPQVKELGRRHVKYNVKEEDYDTVGLALIQTLEIGLGEEFTPPIRDAWLACYALVAQEMKQAGYHGA